MQKLILTLCIIFSFVSLRADEYQILRLNNKTININDKVLTVGDKFSDSDEIKWEKSKSSVMIIQKHNSMQRRLSASDFNNKVKTVLDYFKSIERLSDRSTKFPLMGISDHKKFFESDTFILIDAIFIDSKWRIDAENYFKIRYTYNNKSYSKKIPTRNNVMTITPHILCPEIIASKSEVLLNCQIEYVELDYGEITPITDKLKILYVPLRK